MPAQPKPSNPGIRSELASRPALWLDELVLEMAKTMLRSFVPGAGLGFTMMPWWWLVAAAGSIAAGFVFWSRSQTANERVSRAMLIGATSSSLSLVFFSAAVWRASEACRQPPADGFCFFSGLPFLSLCALYLLIGLIAWIQWVRLRA